MELAIFWKWRFKDNWLSRVLGCRNRQRCFCILRKYSIVWNIL